MKHTTAMTSENGNKAVNYAMQVKMENDKNAKESALPITKILEKIWRNNVFDGFRRFPHLEYDIEQALRIVEAIGKSRNQNFVIDDENRFVYENFIRWCHCDKEMKCLNPETKDVIPGNLKKGIYIAGNTGSGKSWCMDVMRAYCNAIGFRIEYSDNKGPKNLYWWTLRADEICDKFIDNGDVSQFKKVNALCIQDLGSEPLESLYMGNRLDVIRQIIESRGDRSDELTLISSNLKINGDVITARYGERVVSRLAEMCNYFELKGKDRRK